MKRPVICLAVLLLAGCKEEPKKDTTASAAPTNSSIPDDFVVNSFFSQNKGIALQVDGSAAFGDPGSGGGAGGAGEPKNKILDPGGEPKAKLAYTFALNKSQTIIATVGEEVTGPDIPEGQGKQPPLKLTLTATPKKKDGAKTSVELKITKFEMVGAPAEIASKLAPLQASLAKVTVNFSVTPEGDTGDLEFAGAESLQRGPAEQVLSMVARVESVLYVALPGVPVGPGARWKTTTSQDGSSVDSIYTFVGKTDNNYDFKLETSSLTVPKTMQDPRSGKKLTLEVKGGAKYTLSSALDGPTYKGSGDSLTDVIMSENQGPKRTNTEKMSLVIEKSK